jgi:molybdenum cofactor guanylyltransferase
LDVSCVVLAGGKSRRLGRNKVAEVIGGKSILERVISQLVSLKSEIIVVTARDSVLPALDQYPEIKVVQDIVPSTGSLGGIFSGVTFANSFYSLVVAGDMPFLNPVLLKYLINLAGNDDVIIPRMKSQILEPLHAIYSKACLPQMEMLIKDNRLSILELYPLVKVRYVDEQEFASLDAGHLSFFNINTEGDLSTGKAVVEKEGLNG